MTTTTAANEEADTLAVPVTPDRPYHATGVLLGADDFRDRNPDKEVLFPLIVRDEYGGDDRTQAGRLGALRARCATQSVRAAAARPMPRPSRPRPAARTAAAP